MNNAYEFLESNGFNTIHDIENYFSASKFLSYGLVLSISHLIEHSWANLRRFLLILSGKRDFVNQFNIFPRSKLQNIMKRKILPRYKKLLKHRTRDEDFFDNFLASKAVEICEIIDQIPLAEPMNIDVEQDQAPLEEMPQDIPAAMSEETRSKFSELIQQNMDYGKFVQTDFTMENFYDELKKKDLEIFALKKQLEDARMSCDIYKKQVYNVTESRMTWKSKYEPIEYQHRQTVLDPEQTLLFMLEFNLTGRKKARMKTFMRRMEVDFFCVDRLLDEHISEIYNPNWWIYKKIDGIGVILAKDVFKLLKNRMQILYENNKLSLNPRNSNLLSFCFVFDKGSDTTKLGVFPITTFTPNNARNLSLCGLYKGNDGTKNLTKYFTELFGQFSEINNRSIVLTKNGVETEFKIEIIDTGDMPAMCSLYGAQFLYLTKNPCLFCYIEKGSEQKAAPLRTLESMKRDALTHSYGQKVAPLVEIPLTNVSPSSLHIFLGVVLNVIKKIEKLAKDFDIGVFEKIQKIYSKYRIEKQAHFGGTFTGNQIHKLIGSDAILQEISQAFPIDFKKKSVATDLINILKILSKIQSCTKATYLTDEDINKLSQLIDELEEWYKKLGQTKYTPKLHWLVCHVKEFVARKGYWGLSSEQPIESLHHFINDDLHQLSAIKDEETLYNQLVKFQWLRNYYFDKTELKKKDKTKTMTDKESTNDDDSDFSVEL